MRILFLTQVLPYPLNAGPKVRAYYTLRYLSEQHEVTLISFVRQDDSVEAVAHLQTFCQAVHPVPMRRSHGRDAMHLLRSLFSDLPFLIARDQVPEMMVTKEKLLRPAELPSALQVSRSGLPSEHFDVIHADQLWMAPYARDVSRASGNFPAPATVLDQHNAVFQIPRRLAAYEHNPLKRALLDLESRKLERYERRICSQFDRVVWVTDEDRIALNGQQADVESHLEPDDRSEFVIPICVDPLEQRPVRRRADAHRVTFLGGLHWPPNTDGIVWFTREVWPRVRREVPGAVLTIIGKSPPSELLDLAGDWGDTDITGYVPDPITYLAETAVFIVPLHAGGGMRVKILDAWCWGLPVVSTAVGAEGIRVQDGEDVLMASDPTTFARAVVRVLSEPRLASKLAASGRRTVQTHYNWRNQYKAWDGVYAGLERYSIGRISQSRATTAQALR